MNNRKKMTPLMKAFTARMLVAVMLLMAVMLYPSGITKAASLPKLNKTTLNLMEGKQYSLKVTNKQKGSTYSWSTSNKKVATVSQMGIVKGVSKGKATITCKITTKNNKLNLICKVNVLKKDKTNTDISKTTPTPDNNTTPTPTPAATTTDPVITQAPTVTPAASDTTPASKTAIEITKEMGNGWNLGNTMEAVATWLPASATAMDYEKAWGQPTTTKSMIDGLKTAGFNSVRIPVSWSNMMSKDGSYTISPDYFKRVDEIISYVLDNNMYAIINDHYDGGWWDNFGSTDNSLRKEAMKKYETMWTQIAKHYANYSDQLIFESANEEIGAFKEAKSVDESYLIVNQINQKFVDLIRGSGDNNKTRYLLIAGYNTDIDKTCDDRFVMPKDTIQNHLIISVHYYTPSTFCIANKKDNSWGYMDSWGTDKDKELMRTQFVKMQKFTKAGYGVIIGEYGVTYREDGSVKTGTDQFFKSVVSISKEFNYCAMLWDCNAWYDRNAGAFKDQGIASIYK